MNISARTDYSYLFNSMNNYSYGNKSGSTDLLGSINLSDYSSIKSGGYGKLMKAYYSAEDGSDKKSDLAKISKTDVTEKEDATAKSDAAAKSDTTAKSDTSSKEDYLDKIIKQSRSIYTNAGNYGDANAVTAGAMFSASV